MDDEVGKGIFPRRNGRIFDKAAYKADIVKIMHRPSTSRPWYVFRTGNSGRAKFHGARRFYAENRAVIDDVAQKYGVPAELIVAIIGIETNYGKNTGSFRVADALATLGFDYPSRAGFSKRIGRAFKAGKEEGMMFSPLRAAMRAQWVCRNLCLRATGNGRWIMTGTDIGIYGATSVMSRHRLPII